MGEWVRYKGGTPDVGMGEVCAVSDGKQVWPAWWHELGGWGDEQGQHFDGSSVKYYQPIELPEPPKPVYECPFCGGVTLKSWQTYDNMWRMSCAHCRAMGPIEDREPEAMAHFLKEG